LCSAPGSWSQVLKKKIYIDKNLDPIKFVKNPKIVSVDLQDVSPISGVHDLKGDITQIQTAATIVKLFDNN